MCLKKIFTAIIFAALISLNTCYAAETLAMTESDSEGWLLAISKDNSGDTFFVVYNYKMEQGALLPYERKIYDFYLNKGQYGYPPLIFIMRVANSPRDVDQNLGKWSDDGAIHFLPVYSNFEYENGRVIPETYPTSGAGLKPSHYQGKIQSPYHIKLVKVFMTKMPELHAAVERQGVTLP